MKIYPFSRLQRDLKQDLYDKSSQCEDHLIKIFLFPEASAYNHWVTEVYSFLHDVKKLKGKNKRPSAKFILDHTWGYWEDTILDYIPTFFKDYPRLKAVPESKYQLIYDNIYEYMKWLSEELSRVGRVSRFDVKSKLDELKQNM